MYNNSKRPPSFYGCLAIVWFVIFACCFVPMMIWGSMDYKIFSAFGFDPQNCTLTQMKIERDSSSWKSWIGTYYSTDANIIHEQEAYFYYQDSYGLDPSDYEVGGFILCHSEDFTNSDYNVYIYKPKGFSAATFLSGAFSLMTFLIFLNYVVEGILAYGEKRSRDKAEEAQSLLNRFV
jgi:hypothetical protein